MSHSNYEVWLSNKRCLLIVGSHSEVAVRVALTWARQIGRCDQTSLCVSVKVAVCWEDGLGSRGRRGGGTACPVLVPEGAELFAVLDDPALRGSIVGS